MSRTFGSRSVRERSPLEPASTSRRKSMSDTLRAPRPSPIPLSQKPGNGPRSSPASSAHGAPPGEAGSGAGKTACIRTFGCQMNVHDSDRMRRMVQDAGYAEVQRYEDADLVILNTCYVRENAVDRVRGHLGEL